MIDRRFSFKEFEKEFNEKGNTKELSKLLEKEILEILYNEALIKYYEIIEMLNKVGHELKFFSEDLFFEDGFCDIDYSEDVYQEGKYLYNKLRVGLNLNVWLKS